MSSGLNKVMQIGNLVRDPEIRYSASGAAIANITIANSEKWTDKQSGEKKEKSEFHRVVAFNRLAEIMGEYLKKGSQVYIEGKLQTRKWQDKDGQDRYTTEIVANEMKMLGGRGGSGGADFNQGQGGGQQQSAPQQGGAAASAGGSNFDDFDDDTIPF